MTPKPPASLTASLLVRKGNARPMGGMAEPDVVANAVLTRQHEEKLPLFEQAENARIEAEEQGIYFDVDGLEEQISSTLRKDLNSTVSDLDVDDAIAGGGPEGTVSEAAEATCDFGQSETDTLEILSNGADTEEVEHTVADASTEVVLYDPESPPQHPLPVVFRPSPLPTTTEARAMESQSSIDDEPLPPPVFSSENRSSSRWISSIAAALLLLAAGGLAGFLMVRMVADSRTPQTASGVPAQEVTSPTASSVATVKAEAETVAASDDTPQQLTEIVDAAADKVASAQSTSTNSTSTAFASVDDSKPTLEAAVQTAPVAGHDIIASANDRRDVPAPRRRSDTLYGAKSEPPLPTRRPTLQIASGMVSDTIGGRYRVQIGTVFSKADVALEMDRLRSHFPKILGDAEISVVPRAGQYRLMTGRFADASSAEAACDHFKAGRQSCLVVRR